jgi:hypothetical protein
MKLALTLTTLLALQALQPAWASSDDFNRCGLQGQKWTLLSGSLHIENCAYLAAGDETQDVVSLGIFKKADAGDHVGSMDVMFTGTQTQFAAIALGDISNGNNAFIKVQSQNGLGTISHLAFYVGNNNGRGGKFFKLNGLDGVSSARITAKVVSSRLAKVMIDTNFDGIPERIIGFRYGQSFPHGVGAALLGSTRADNFKSGGYAPRAGVAGAPALTMAVDTLVEDVDLTQ